MMDLDDLDLFRAIVREGGVIRAAGALNRVPSAVTTRLKHLEARLGVPLFHRRGRGLVLTDSGQTLLLHAERLLRLADEAEQAIRGPGVKGVLTLGALESTAGTRLPPILSAFHARHPDVSIDLRTGTTGDLLRRLNRFEIEAAFVSEPFEPGALFSLPVFAENLVLISAHDIPSPAGPADLNGVTVVAFPRGCSYRRRLMEWLADGGAAAGRVMELASYHAIVACVAAGSGVAIVPESVLDHAVLGAAVRRHPLPGAPRQSRTHLVWSGEPGAALRALMALLPAGDGPDQAR
jgi:DNA-binding transcriptional LysR family regulator